MRTRPLRGLSVLLVDDDALAAFRLRRALVSAGARVAAVPAGEADAYLASPELAAIVVAGALNGPDAAAIAPSLAAAGVPWVVYGTHRGALSPAGAATSVAAGEVDRLIRALADLCMGQGA